MCSSLFAIFELAWLALEVEFSLAQEELEILSSFLVFDRELTESLGYFSFSRGLLFTLVARVVCLVALGIL